LLPLSILKGRKLLTDTREGEQVYDWKEGRNVSSLLGVTKWEPMIPLCLSGKVKGSFPGFLPKTDETRVQVLQPVLDKHKGTLCYVTEKCDGSSATFYMKDGVFGVCSRNLELLETPENAFWQMARKLQIEEKLKTNKLDNIAIQGELCGPGIQSNPLQLKEFNIFFFNVYDIKEGKYKDVVELTNMCVLLRLNMVPIIERHYKLNNDVQALVTYATRKSVYNPNVWLEGIVIRPIEEIEDREFMNVLNYNRVSFKVINPEYLICNDG
jgi:RNA ligase (TIGR02306 family)